MDLDNMFADVMGRVRQVQQQRTSQYLGSAGAQPIPGLTGPVIPGAGVIPGQMPPMQMPPMQTPPMQMPGGPPFMASGPYGQQAMQLAGLLGGRMQIPRVVDGAQTQGLLGGGVKGMRIPFYRPTGK